MKICAGGGGRSEPASASRDALPSTYSRTLDASLSSATIPDDMTMSTCSVLDRLGPGDAGEKESLVRRLRELVLSEETEVDRNLAEAKQRLSRVEAEYARSVNELKQEAAKEEENLLKTQREEFALLQSTQAKEEADAKLSYKGKPSTFFIMDYVEGDQRDPTGQSRVPTSE